MSYNRITWAPAALRAAGLTVIEHPGWRMRGLGDYKPFEPSAVVWHHDASPVGDSPSVPAAMIANFENAASQFWVDRAGRWHIIASGRAPHAGDVLPGMPDNTTSIGVETDHTTGEPWTVALLASLRKGTAALLRYLKRDAKRLYFHSTICSPPGRKIDPTGLDLTTERWRVGRWITPLPAVSLARLQRAAKIPAWRRALNPRMRADVDRVRKALDAEGWPNYRQFQLGLHYSEASATGIPDPASLKILGRKRGFRVVA